MTVNLTDKECEIIRYCIELVSLNTRNFNLEEEKALKNITEKFHTEYDVNCNNNWIPPQA